MTDRKSNQDTKTERYQQLSFLYRGYIADNARFFKKGTCSRLILPIVGFRGRLNHTKSGRIVFIKYIFEQFFLKK